MWSYCWCNVSLLFILVFFSILSLQLFWGTDHKNCSWANVYHNKNTSLQKIYYYQSFVSDNCILSNIEFCTDSFLHNWENITTKFSCSAFYITFSRNLFYLYNHCSAHIHISLCSVKITEDNKQKTLWN